jgi:hypothetical protein
MADPQPMIRLEENGQPPVLNYEIPDATSYDGRYYLELVLPKADFVPEVSVDRSGGVINKAPVLAPVLVLMRDAVDTREETGGDTNTGRPIFNKPTTEREGDAAWVEVAIIEPASATRLSGPAEGLKITVRGSLQRVGRLKTLDVWLDGQSLATQLDRNTFFRVWSAQAQIATSGQHTVRVRAVAELESEDYADERTRMFEVTLAEPAAKPPDDTSAPSLRILSPTPDTVFADIAAAQGNGSAEVKVEGSASDPSGIDNVKVIVDDESQLAVNATPNVAGDWNSWTAKVQLIGAGPHSLTVTAQDKFLNSTTVRIEVVLAAHPPRRWLYSRLMIVEKVRLSNFLGRYGAGRVLKTFSLLPGEKMEISLKSYRRSTDLSKQSSSVFDHVDNEATNEFITGLNNEHSDKQMQKDSFEWSVDAKLEQGWGSGGIEVKGHVAGSSNSAREQFAKATSNVSQKHAGRKSSVRDIKVNAESESRVETGEEESIKRNIENINTGRTLNFVFRQMNQEFASILHLVDIRIGYAAFFQPLNGGQRIVEYREVSIAELDSMLNSVVREGKRAEVKTAVMSVLENISDYQDNLTSIIEEVILIPNTKDVDKPARDLAYWRVRPNLVSEWEDPVSHLKYKVPGIVLSGTNVVMRTEGVIVESVLGGGSALDAYSKGLQQATIMQRDLENDRVQAQVNLAKLEHKLIEDADEQRVNLLDKIKDRPAPSLTLALTDKPNA